MVQTICGMRDFYLVVRFTRNWIHYGFLSHIAICIFIGALKGVFGR